MEQSPDIDEGAEKDPRWPGECPASCDVAIVGAGAGGLTAAALLARSGLSVVLLEADRQVGGYLAGFERRGFLFDTSIEWLNQCQPGGFVNTLFQFIDPNAPVCPPLKRIHRFHSGPLDYLLTHRPDDLRDRLIRDFPSDESGIRAFFRDARALGERIKVLDRRIVAAEILPLHERAVFYLRMARWALPIVRHVRTPVERMLRRYFSPDLQRLFSSQDSTLAVMVPIAWAYAD
ncbi:MAG: NAD(P)-binding protein, partial [Kiritimatiellia bacterium]|nr:NAD(P)-binding protein [Kiritimatiellia bacterium]